jgi:hypothetical protein
MTFTDEMACYAPNETYWTLGFDENDNYIRLKVSIPYHTIASIWQIPDNMPFQVFTRRGDSRTLFMGVYQGFDLCCFFLPLLPQSMLKSVETSCGISDFRMSGYALCQ